LEERFGSPKGSGATGLSFDGGSPGSSSARQLMGKGA